MGYSSTPARPPMFRSRKKKSRREKTNKTWLMGLMPDGLYKYGNIWFGAFVCLNKAFVRCQRRSADSKLAQHGGNSQVLKEQSP